MTCLKNFWLLLTALTLLWPIGCSSLSAITVSDPKVFEQHDVVRVLAEYRTRIKKAADNLPTSSLQETFGVQQLSRTDTNTSASPTSGNLLSAPSPVESPDLQFRDPQGIVQGLGLPSRSLLRNIAVNNQLLMGYDLLFKGDSRFLSNDYQVVLVRFDVSINRYLRNYIWREFALVLFSVNAICSSPPCKDEVSVYALFPEYSGITAQESLLTSAITSQAAQSGATNQGLDVQTGRRTQNALQEQLISLIEHPQQFAIYEPFQTLNGKTFAFAFGPRRRIEKRGLYNPSRWLGDTYTIDYEIEPGPRDLYAILLVPKDAVALTLSARPIPYTARDSELADVHEAVKDLLQDKYCGQVQNNCIEPPIRVEDKKVQEDSQVAISSIRESSDSQNLREGFFRHICPTTLQGDLDKRCRSQNVLDHIQLAISLALKPSLSSLRKLPKLTRITWTKQLATKPIPITNPLNVFSCEVSPPRIAVAVPSSVFISCNEPLSQDTDILLGPLAIPPQNVSLLNRFQIKVTLSPNKVMEAVAKAQSNSLEWSIISQGKFALPVIPKTLNATITPATAPASFVVSPPENQPGGLIKITLANNSAADVLYVQIGGQRATIQSRKNKVLTLTLPANINPVPKGKLPVVIKLLSKPGNPLIRKDVFKYSQ